MRRIDRVYGAAWICSIFLHAGVAIYFIMPTGDDPAETTLRFVRSVAGEVNSETTIRFVRASQSQSRAQTTENEEQADAAGQEFDSDVVARENLAIQNRIQYPELARRMNWQGRVRVLVRVTATGEVDSVSVIESSGYDVLDEAARTGVTRHRFPSSSSTQSIELSFLFRLRGSQ